MHDHDSNDAWRPLGAPLEAIISRLSQDGAADPAVLRAAIAAATAFHSTPLVEQHYGLTQAARKFFPDGSVTRRSLLTEIGKGRLRATKVAGKYLVSESDIHAMLEACRCKGVDVGDESNLPDSISANGLEESQHLSFSTAHVKLAQASARANLAALKKPSKTISPANTDLKPVRLRSLAS